MMKKNVKEEFTTEEKKMLGVVGLGKGEEVVEIFAPAEWYLGEVEYYPKDYDQPIRGGTILTNYRFFFMERKGPYISILNSPTLLIAAFVHVFNSITRRFRKYTLKVTIPLRDIKKIERE